MRAFYLTNVGGGGPVNLVSLGVTSAARVELRQGCMEFIMNFAIECELEDDGRWLAEVPQLPGVMTYGSTRDKAMTKAQVLALRVLAERLKHGESRP